MTLGRRAGASAAKELPALTMPMTMDMTALKKVIDNRIEGNLFKIAKCQRVEPGRQLYR
jgi:hypothetical protein